MTFGKIVRQGYFILIALLVVSIILSVLFASLMSENQLGLIFLWISALLVLALIVLIVIFFRGIIRSEENIRAEDTLVKSNENVVSESEHNYFDRFDSCLDRLKALKEINDPEDQIEATLKILATELEGVQSVFYLKEQGKDEFIQRGKYAVNHDNPLPERVVPGQGICGIVAQDKKILITDKMPEDDITVFSGLGAGPPKYMCILPLIIEGETIGLIQLFTFLCYDAPHMIHFDSLAKIIAGNLNLEAAGIYTK